MTSFRVCRCVVCDTKFKCLPFSHHQNNDTIGPTQTQDTDNVNDDGNPSTDEDSRINKNKLLWESFSSFFCLSHHLFTSADPEDPSKEISILPFCEECTRTVAKLSDLYQQLGLIQSEISTTIGSISWTVIKTTKNSTTTVHEQTHNDSEQNNLDPEITVNVKNEENREIHTNIDNDNESVNNINLNEDLDEDPEISNIVKHVRQLICDQFSPEVRLNDSVKSVQRKKVLKRRRNLKKERDRKRRAEQRKQRKQTSIGNKKTKHTKPLPALIKIKTEQKVKSDDDFEVIDDNNQEEEVDNIHDDDEPLSPPSAHNINISSNLDDTRDGNYDSFDEYFNDDTTNTATKKKTKDEKNVNEEDNKRKRPKRKVASKIPEKKQKGVKKDKIVIENVCENESNSDVVEDDDDEVVVEEDSDFNPDVERSQMRRERKMRPSEIRLTTGKKKKKKNKGPEYISFQQLVLQDEEISPGQFMLGGKYPYEKTGDGDFTCKVGECIFSTKAQKEIHSHLYHMHNEQRFPCNDCLKSYESEKKLDNHVCRPHSKRRVMYKTSRREDGSFAYHDKWSFFKVGELFQCATCNAFKAKLNSMGTHIREHHIEPDRYKCPHPNCDNAYGNRKSFLCHTALHLPDRDFLCEECSMSFKSASNLQRHKLVHSSKMFECNICHKKYMYAEGLNRHRREQGHLSEKVLAARLAITTSADSPSELDLSMTSATNSIVVPNSDPQSTLTPVTTSFMANLVCPSCNIPQENAKKFNIHISFCGKPKKYLCDFCSKGFHVKSYLQRHITRYHGDGGSSEPVEKQTRRKRSDYQDNNNTTISTTTPTSNYQFQQQSQQQPSQEQEQQALQLLRGQENVQIHVAEFLTNTAFFTQLPHERIFN